MDAPQIYLVSNSAISIYHERPVTENEKADNPGSTMVCEWVHLTFQIGKEVDIKMEREFYKPRVELARAEMGGAP